MFERFPQLKRLERLLSKAQGPQSKKTRSPHPSQDNIDSPMASLKQTTPGKLPKAAILTTVDSASEVNHSMKIPSTKPDGGRLLTVVDQSTSEPSTAVSSHLNKKKKVERRRIWTTALRSPREMFRGKVTNTCHKKTVDRTPFGQVERLDRPNIPKPPIKRVFFRQMQEAPASDGLNVLSEEEIDDQENDVEDIPDYIVPMDFHSMMNKSSRFEPNLTALMECRNRLASSYTLLDDLCTSFRGQANLERFLRSLIAAGSETPGRSSPPHCDATQNKDDQCPSSHSMAPVNSSTGSSCTASCETTSTSYESRLMRLTVSTMMKRVEPFANRPKRVMAADASTDCSAYGGYGCRPSTHRTPSKAARSPASRVNKSHHTPPPLSEEEAREDLMYRVRHGLLNLPWILRRRSSSFSRMSHNHSIAPPTHGYMTACIS